MDLGTPARLIPPRVSNHVMKSIGSQHPSKPNGGDSDSRLSGAEMPAVAAFTAGSIDLVDRVLDDELRMQDVRAFGAGWERDLLKALKCFVAAIDGNRDPKVARSLALRLGRLESLTMQVRDLASAAWERTE